MTQTKKWREATLNSIFKYIFFWHCPRNADGTHVSGGALYEHWQSLLQEVTHVFDGIHEWGFDAMPPNDNVSHFLDVLLSLHIKSLISQSQGWLACKYKPCKPDAAAKEKPVAPGGATLLFVHERKLSDTKQEHGGSQKHACAFPGASFQSLAAASESCIHLRWSLMSCEEKQQFQVKVLQLWGVCYWFTNTACRRPASAELLEPWVASSCQMLDEVNFCIIISTLFILLYRICRFDKASELLLNNFLT